MRSSSVSSDGVIFLPSCGDSSVSWLIASGDVNAKPRASRGALKQVVLNIDIFHLAGAGYGPALLCVEMIESQRPLLCEKLTARWLKIPCAIGCTTD